ncbi:MAG TPA: 2-hydroxyacid dehydrogenase [Nitrospirota bacterium]|nr:2-hydroxyacid dehydrogenase [Nitrospirota bacterium]
MERHHLVVTYTISEAKRALLKEIFGEEVRLSFLADMPSGLREQTLVGASVLLSWNLPKELGPGELGWLTNVRMIQLLSAGADHVPFTGLPPGIVIASNVGAYADPMAEHVLAMTLALAKNLSRGHQGMARGEFNQSRLNRRLRGCVCGILGFGGIGRATARLMRALGARIYAVNTSGRTEEPVEFIGTLNDLQRVISSSDVVVISLPLTKATRGLIGKRELEWMKPNAILINVARGDIIDEGALYAHLSIHPEFLAGIDAWWIEPFRSGEFCTNYPFLTLPNVLGSPHNSAMVPGITDEGTMRAAENIKHFLKGEIPVGVVRREDYI